MSDFVSYALIGVVVLPILAYLVVRFATAAFFNSKHHYESEKRHEPR